MQFPLLIDKLMCAALFVRYRLQTQLICTYLLLGICVPAILIVKHLVSVRGCRPGKIVQMTEAEVRGLCIKSREIFLSQPILLELEAPLKICGM